MFRAETPPLTASARVPNVSDVDISTPEPEREPKVAPALAPAVFHLLLALARGEAHGDALMREVERMTAGRTSIGPGTLYRSERRMLVDGLIVERGGGGAGAEDERRRVYRMTEFGLEGWVPPWSGRRATCTEPTET